MIKLIEKGVFFKDGKLVRAKSKDETEKDILTAAGIDLTKYMNSSGIIEHAYLFGLLRLFVMGG